jgi:para-nitrobenzyl esterase
VLIGSNHDEALFGLSAAAAEAEALMRTIFGDAAADQVLAHYPVNGYPDPGMAVSTAISDATFACSTRTIAGLLSRNVPTYTYEFDDPDPPLHPFEELFFGPAPHGAFHGAELKYWIRWLRQDPPFDADQRALSDQMIAYWSHFVASGDPTVAGLPPLPRYRPATDLFLSLRPGGNVLISDFAAYHQCAFWDNADFPLPEG